MKMRISPVVTVFLLGIIHCACTRSNVIRAPSDLTETLRKEKLTANTLLPQAGRLIHVASKPGALESALLSITNGMHTTVVLEAGVYWQTNTIHLTRLHNGLCIRAAQQGAVLINSGVRVRKSDWQRVTDETLLKRLAPSVRSKLYGLELKKLGVRHTGPYPDTFGDFGGLCQLMVEQEWMPLSRFPNSGYLKVDKVLDKGDLKGGKGTRGGAISIKTPHVDKWGVSDGLWLQGFWVVPWTRTAIKVADIDVQTQTATFAVGVNRGIGSKYAKPPALGNGMEEFCVINSLDELDMPGEWCVRFTDGRLYFISPTDEPPEEALIADHSAPMVSLSGATNVVIEGLCFNGNLGDGIAVDHSSHVQINGCTFARICGTAVVMKNAHRHRIQSCDFVDIGKSGVVLSGGDRKMLISSECTVDNSRFWRIGRHQNTYAPPIDCKEGVGYVITHNFFHDLPHAAVLYSNNNDSRFDTTVRLKNPVNRALRACRGFRRVTDFPKTLEKWGLFRKA